MLKRLVLALSFWSAIGIAAMAYAGNAIVGVVTKVNPDGVEVRTADSVTEAIALTERTQFIKSFNGKHRLSWPEKVPRWQHDIRVDARALRVGTAVRIDVSSGPPRAAQTVWMTSGR